MEQREIKFRGIRLDDFQISGKKNWCYGYPVPFFYRKDEQLYLMDKVTGSSIYGHPIIPETLGEFTGMCDIHGQEIYEGDIVRFRITDSRHTKNPRFVNLVVNYDASGARWQVGNMYWQTLHAERMEVIGNVYLNQKLLEEENKYKIVNHEKCYFFGVFPVF